MKKIILLLFQDRLKRAKRRTGKGITVDAAGAAGTKETLAL